MNYLGYLVGVAAIVLFVGVGLWAHGMAEDRRGRKWIRENSWRER